MIFVKGSTQMRLPIVFKFIIYTKSFSASLVPKMQWTPWFHLMWSEAVLLAGVSWGDGRTIPGCCTLCLAASSIHVCLNSGSHLYWFIWDYSLEGDTTSVLTHWTTAHSPHLVDEPLITFCVPRSVCHQCSQRWFGHPVWVFDLYIKIKINMEQL